MLGTVRQSSDERFTREERALIVEDSETEG